MQRIKTLIAALFIVTSAFAVADTTSGTASEGSFIKGIANMMYDHIAKILEKSGDPANGIIDAALFEKNVQASIDQVEKMPDSSEKEILSSANANLSGLVGLIKNGTFTKAHIIGFYTNLKN